MNLKAYFTFNLIVLFSPLAFSNVALYYGQEVHEIVLSSQPSKALKKSLHNVLSQFHIQNTDGFDVIKSHCPENMNCYIHTLRNYNESREFMFGVLDIRKSPDNRLFVEDRYCHQIYYFDKEAMNKKRSFIPDNRIFNTEHTWPQSKFSSRFPKALQKSDLHALYPVQAQANNLRSNLPLFWVEKPETQSCVHSQKGQNNLLDEKVFEPPDNHKGNAARSIFYFVVRYDLSLPKEYEMTLRAWHKLDPVDEAEKTRNQGIFEFQQNRNPFVDFEKWLDLLEL